MSATLPDILIDHCLGTKAIPAVFRSAGLSVATVAELFGRSDVPDTEILEYAGKHGVVFVTKDSAIRRNKVERDAVFSHGVRLVCMVHADITSSEMAKVFDLHMPKIVKAMDSKGSWVLTVSRSEVKDITKELRQRMKTR